MLSAMTRFMRTETLTRGAVMGTRQARNPYGDGDAGPLRRVLSACGPIV